LHNARRAGASIRIRNGKSVVSSDEPLTDDVMAALREHRDRLIEILSLEGGQAATGVELLYWRAFDHLCSTACGREHVVCNACSQPLRQTDRHWPHLHLDCRLELED
jgi:hypothetical protein